MERGNKGGRGEGYWGIYDIRLKYGEAWVRGPD